MQEVVQIIKDTESLDIDCAYIEPPHGNQSDGDSGDEGTGSMLNNLNETVRCTYRSCFKK